MYHNFLGKQLEDPDKTPIFAFEPKQCDDGREKENHSSRI